MAIMAADHWQQFHESWTGLLTYRYLGKRTPVLDLGVERETMPLRHDMRNSTGGVLAAPLAIAAPEPYWLDDEVVPAPVLMSYEIVDPARDVSEVEVLRELTHIGKTMGFSRSRIVDAADHARLIAVCTGVGVSLGVQPDDFEPVANPPIEVEDSPSMPPLPFVFGATRGDDGLWRLPVVSPPIAAPHGALHLGPINIVLEAAAMDVVGDSTQVESWTISMVRPGTVGPFRAEASVLATGDRIPVQLTLYDEGRDDRAIATAIAAYRRV
jgi:acyl-coenzyme A thioesterase PaaI-like protein